MDTPSAAYVLTSVEVVLQRILECLSVVDLHRVQRVCKVWRSTAQIVIQNRMEGVEALSIFQESGKESEIDRALEHWRSTWKHLPREIVCVCLAEKGSRETDTLEARHLLYRWLPPESKLLVFETRYSAVCVDGEHSSKENVVGALGRFYNVLSFPHKPGSYSVGFLGLKRHGDVSERKQFYDSVQEELAHSDTKMVLVCERFFKVELFHDFYRGVLDPAARRGVVVLGGIVESEIVFSPNGKSSSEKDLYQDMVLMILKGRNVQSASVLVEEKIKTIHGVEVELEKLKMTMQSFCEGCPDRCENRSRTGYCASCNSQTVGLMISGCAPDISFFFQSENENASSLKRNEEQEVFRRILSNVPILGAFVWSKIGKTTNIVSDDKTIAGADDLYRRDCRVFAVVVLK